MNIIITADHHWNGWGALDSYRAISNEFGLAGLEKFYRADAAMGNVFMNGSYARSGLMMLDEAVNEPSVSLENLTIVSGNAPALATPDPRRYITDKALSAEFDWYHFWYGPSSELVLEGGGASGFFKGADNRRFLHLGNPVADSPKLLSNQCLY